MITPRVLTEALAAGGDEAKRAFEAALEQLDLKRAVFAELDEAADAETILATNTSALSVTKIAESTALPERVVGLHFFNPVPVLSLVELVPSLLTAYETTERARTFRRVRGRRHARGVRTPAYPRARCAPVLPLPTLALRGDHGVLQPKHIV